MSDLTPSTIESAILGRSTTSSASDVEPWLSGMAIGVLQSDVYGLAIRARDLRRVLEDAAARVRTEEARLQALGCDPGQVDGVFDARTWEAYGCERAGKN